MLTYTVPCDFSFSDIIMDMLGDRKMRKIVNRYYEDSGEPKLVRKAVDEAWRKEQNYNAENDGKGTLSAKFQTLRCVCVCDCVCPCIEE